MKPRSENPLILVVDDEEQIRRTLRRALSREGLEVLDAASAEEALTLLQDQPVDLLLTDIFLPEGMSGIDLMARVRHLRPDLPALVMSGRSDIATAVEAMKQGAEEFLEKPFPNIEMVALAIKKSLRTRNLVRENEQLREGIRARSGEPMLIGCSPPMARLKRMIERVAPVNSTLMITGETGTGKEIVARAIHQLSPRAGGRFLAVNCAGFQETLLESSLFGYEKGAYTGALKRTKGVFEEADGGTLLLDEIGDTPLGLQSKLLRVLQNHTFQRLGSTADIEVDVRVLAATNRDLRADVEKGRFRQDLFYRLNVIEIRVPALRDRLDDVGLLAQHFVNKHNVGLNRNIRGLSPDALAALQRRDWPGNVRELENLIERAVALAEGEVLSSRDIDPLSGPEPAPVAAPPAIAGETGLRYAEAKAVFERDYLVRALERAGGNVAQASRDSAIPRQNFYQKIRKFQLEPESFRK